MEKSRSSRKTAKKASPEPKALSLETQKAEEAPARVSAEKVAGEGIGSTRKRSWDVVSLLEYHEPIGGLAISEDALAYAFYRDAGRRGLELKIQEEVALPAGTVVLGVLRDRAAFVSCLRALKGKIAIAHESVIVSLFPKQVWMTKLEFPLLLKKNYLTEAVELYLESSLPFAQEDCYADWEIDERREGGVQAVTVGAVRQTFVRPYLEALLEAGFTAIAVESQVMSIMRTLPGKGKLLLALVYPSGVHLAAAEDRLVRFQRFVPWDRIPMGTGEIPLERFLAEHIEQVMHFLITEPHDVFEVRQVVLVAPHELHDQVRACAEELTPFLDEGGRPGFDTPLLAAKGAALRGVLARKDDTIMSFTEVGTEEIYEWKRASSLSALFVKLSVWIGLFFLALYAGSYLFVSQLAARAEARQASGAAISEDLVLVQEEAKKFNQALEQAAELAGRAPQWNKLFDSMTHIANPGIMLSSVSVDASNSVAIAGVAKSRDALLQMKAAIAGSPVFQDIELPFALLIAKEDIPFRLTLLLRDPRFFFVP